MSDLTMYSAVSTARSLIERGFAIHVAADMAAKRFCCPPVACPRPGGRSHRRPGDGKAGNGK